MRQIMLVAAALLFAGCEPLSPEARFDREIAADPQASMVMAALASDFPDEHRALRAELIGHVQSGAGGDAIRRSTMARMNQLIDSNRQHLAAAPDRQMLRLLSTQLAAAEALKSHDVGQCAAFVMGGFGHAGTAGDAVQAAVAESTIAVLRAAAAGKRSPARRGTGPLHQSEIDAFAAAMRAEGADAAMVDAALGDGFAAMPPARQCDGGIMLMRAVEALPRDQSIKLFALLVGNG